MEMNDKLKIGLYEFNSRLIVGTGKYSSFDVMIRAHEASGAELVTVAIARVNLNQPASGPTGRPPELRSVRSGARPEGAAAEGAAGVVASNRSIVYSGRSAR